MKINNMAGLARLCKLYGRVKCYDARGNEVVWLYDYAMDKPRLKSEMTKDEINASEKAKWQIMKKEIMR